MGLQSQGTTVDLIAVVVATISRNDKIASGERAAIVWQACGKRAQL
jgi:hypothetical protein